MVIKESQVKAIIQEEIQKMIEEGEMEEGWFSDKAGEIGRNLVGKAARLTGYKSGELAAQEKSDKEREQFSSEMEYGRKRQQAVMAAYNTVMSGLGAAERGLIDLEDYMSREEGNKLSDAANKYSQAVETAVEKALNYKSGSLRESRKRRFKK